MDEKKRVVIGLLGTEKDARRRKRGAQPWRPTPSLFELDTFRIDELDLVVPLGHEELAKRITSEIQDLSPETKVRIHPFTVEDPWDLDQVYPQLFSFAEEYEFDTSSFEYLVHMGTGTHVTQTCLFLLTIAREIPGKLIQTWKAPPTDESSSGFRVIDPVNFGEHKVAAESVLRSRTSRESVLTRGIRTLSPPFREMISELQRITTNSTSPILLLGPTGCGKTQLARQVYELKRQRGLVDGKLVEVNCGTLRGDHAMSSLFGHLRGAFTGASSIRKGYLREADRGVLFLDEIAELGLDEQAMLLNAIESKSFYPMGSDVPVKSDFQLITGTNRNLRQRVAEGTFREDLLYRIDLWSFTLPRLRDRPEDIAPNVDFELERFRTDHRKHIRFESKARRHYLEFAESSDALWAGNFRDLGRSIIRMCTLAESGEITQSHVIEEVKRLRAAWSEITPINHTGTEGIEAIIGTSQWQGLDLFEKAQLRVVYQNCLASTSLSEAGRRLFSSSRKVKKTTNDADRVRKFLLRYGIDWRMIMRGYQR